MKACVSFPPITEQAIIYLKNVWEGMFPPVEETDVLQKWFAGLYYKTLSSKPLLFVGKAIRRFLQSEKGPAQFLELDCLQLAVTTYTTELHEVPQHLQRDLGLFSIPDIIAGPLTATYKGKGVWLFPDYPDFISMFLLVLKINRDEEYAKVYAR